MREGQIFLIRHGQTSWNKERYQGWGDPSLDQTGKEQAELILECLKEEPIDQVFSSSLIRAIETVRPLVIRRHLPMFLSDDLRELNYGSLEGKKKSEYPLKVKKDNHHLPVPGGESLFDLYKRSGRFIGEIRKELLSAKSLIIVGHYWSNRMVLGAIRNNSFDAVISEPDYRPENGSIYTFSYRANSDNAMNIDSLSFRRLGLNEEKIL